MNRKKMMMWVGGAALAAVAVGGVAYAATSANRPPTPAALPANTLVTQLQPGMKYQFGALLPSGIPDQASLIGALNSAGWKDVTITYWGSGASPAGAPNANLPNMPIGGYAAVGTWNGATNAAVPAGLIVATASA